MNIRHKIQFPPIIANDLAQNESFFYLNENEKKIKLRFHDYNEIFLRPGLYEQLFYERLKCNSPKKVTEALYYSLKQSNDNLSELRVLDLGAGNGIMGEELKKHGVSRLIGVDIINEAKLATERDRPGIYDSYYIADLTKLSKQMYEDFNSWSFNCLTSVAALGFEDIPPKAFFESLNLLQPESWIAFNIKETFLDNSDTSGFSRMIRELIFSEYLDIHHLERYNHRYSIEGKPLYYFAVVCKKNFDIPDEFLMEQRLIK